VRSQRADAGPQSPRAQRKKVIDRQALLIRANTVVAQAVDEALAGWTGWDDKQPLAEAVARRMVRFIHAQPGIGDRLPRGWSRGAALHIAARVSDGYATYDAIRVALDLALRDLRPSR
jgi:hypothetical protein